MLTFALGMILIGSLLLYAGWAGKDLKRLALGDNGTPGKTPSGGARVAFGSGVTS